MADRHFKKTGSRRIVGLFHLIRNLLVLLLLPARLDVFVPGSYTSSEVVGACTPALPGLTAIKAAYVPKKLCLQWLYLGVFCLMHPSLPDFMLVRLATLGRWV